MQIGVVEGVKGISWTEITIAGQSNHAGTTPMRLRRDPGAVAVLPVWPGMPARVIDAVLDSPALRGLILQSYGVGNVPDGDPAWIDQTALSICLAGSCVLYASMKAR